MQRAIVQKSSIVEPTTMNDPTLRYQLRFDERPAYLCVKVSAPTIDRESALLYLREVADHCRKISCRSLMLIRDIPVMLRDADLFFTTTDFLKMIGETRVAFVNPYLPIAAQMDFAILIGKNRGGNYRLFNDEASAEKWLLEN